MRSSIHPVLFQGHQLQILGTLLMQDQALPIVAHPMLVALAL